MVKIAMLVTVAFWKVSKQPRADLDMAVINRPNFLQLDEFKFNFNMTDHLNPQITKNDSLTAICRKIFSYHKLVFPKWTRLRADFRIIKIKPTSTLFGYLDNTSKTQTFNWLIFCRVDNQITVTHFGPFGKKKDKDFDNKVNKTRLSLKKLESKWLKLCSSSQPTRQEQTRLNAIHKKILSAFWGIIKDIEKRIEAQKSELEEVAGHVFTSEESSEHIKSEIGKITVKAGLVTVRQILIALRKEISVEIAKVLAKLAAKETLKEGASKGTAKAIAKAVPFVGLGVGSGFAIWRLTKKDYVGAGLEFASGAVSCEPGAGTAASLAIDAGLAVRDVIKAKNKMETLKTDIERIEKELNKLFEDCENAKSEHDYVREVLGDTGYDFEKLEHDIKVVNEALSD